MADEPVADRLAHLVFHLLRPDRYSPDPAVLGADPEFATIRRHVQQVWIEASPARRQRLSRVRRDLSAPANTNPRALINLIMQLLIDPDTAHRLSERTSSTAEKITPETLARMHENAVRLRLGLLPPEQEAEFIAWLGRHDGDNPEPPPIEVESHEGGHTDQKGTEMTENNQYLEYSDYLFDERNLPETFDQDAFRSTIVELFEEHGHPVNEDGVTAAHAAYVTGALVRASYFTTGGPGFAEAFIEEFNKGYGYPDTLAQARLRATNGHRLTNRDVYLHTASEILQLKSGDRPTYQEVAAVADEVLKRGPVDDGTFDAKVRNAFDDYVSNAPVYDSLELPDLVTDDTAKGDVEPLNIRSVAMIYASGRLEQAGLFTAVDQAAQDWSDGVLPVGDSAGRLFDPYVFDARDRLDAAARQIQYDRINQMREHLLRFCSATSERERGLYLSEYLTGPNRDRMSPQPGDATVRKTARDLLAYASLHGWAYTQFAAKRLGNQIRQCVEIISEPEVQKAYGVQGQWQLVERINTMTSGTTPNLTKQLTLASTGKAIVDLLAGKAKEIAAHRSAMPMFPRRDQLGAGLSNQRAAVFGVDEYDRLLAHVENWLAANAITDTERFNASQPIDTTAVPSLPNLGSDGFGAAADGFDATQVKNQLMQMVSSGQMPTADQVNQMFLSHH